MDKGLDAVIAASEAGWCSQAIANFVTLQRYREMMGEIAGLLAKAADLANRLAEEDSR